MHIDRLKYLEENETKYGGLTPQKAEAESGFCSVKPCPMFLYCMHTQVTNSFFFKKNKSAQKLDLLAAFSYIREYFH